jgi:hypothetical protein
MTASQQIGISYNKKLATSFLKVESTIIRINQVADADFCYRDSLFLNSMIPSVLCAIVLFTTFGSSYDPLQYVDQFIGSSNGGMSVQRRHEKKRLNFSQAMSSPEQLCRTVWRRP